MAESPQNPPPQNTTPDPLMTEPELVSSDLTANATLPPAPPSGRRAAATFIFFTVALDMLALGMIAPVLPRLIEGFLHGDTSSAARMLGLFGTVFAAMQFFFSPIAGSLSDRFGRRPVVLLSNFGLGLDYVLMAWAPALNWLFLGRIISGLTSSSIPTAMAYMADVTPRERRAAAFGMLNAAFGLGFVLGPAIGGLLGNINPRLPFWAAAALSLINGLYGLFVLPESLSKQNRSPFSWARANPVGSLTLLRHGGMIGIAAVLLLGYIAQQVLMNVYVIYDDYRYHWTNRTVGLSLAVVGIFTVIYGAFLIKPVVAKLGERGAMTIGLIGGALGYSMIGSSKTGLLVWIAIPFLNLMSFTWPSAQSLLSRKTSPSEQGQLQGAINGLRGIAGLLGPGFFTYIFSKSIGIGAIVRTPGAPFYVAASMLLIGLILTQYVTRIPKAVLQP
ncbi:TCR/Tet family MFS transporter [Tunturiibacter psychrotolerans]|uniref:TCR/Tet family MFS transporter n=1 Tax=Tunturiibacter psychrotolerans TaxID=3069686 RepID=UPI003D22637D